MKRVLLICLLCAGCNFLRRPEPPEPIVRVDTVTVTVEPELPAADSINVCLSTGVTAALWLTAAGDTLVGPKRVPLSDVRPPLMLPGVYAQGASWFEEGEIIRFDGRAYQRAGVDRVRECDELKLVGEHRGVPLFAEVTAPQVLPSLIVPVRPGRFQDYLRVGR